MECAETNEKSIFRFLQFLVFEIWSFLYSKLAIFHEFSVQNDHNSKNKNMKNLIHEFSFDSSLCAFFMKIGPLLRGAGLVRINPIFFMHVFQMEINLEKKNV